MRNISPEWRGREILDEVMGETPSISRLKKFIDAGAYLEVKGKNGDTPLLAAIKGKKTNAALLLINSGASLAASDEAGHNAFYHAVNTRNLDVLKPLFEQNAPQICPTTNLIGMDRWDDYVWGLKEEIAKRDAAAPIRIMKQLSLKR